MVEKAVRVNKGRGVTKNDSTGKLKTRWVKRPIVTSPEKYVVKDMNESVVAYFNSGAELRNYVCNTLDVNYPDLG